MPINIKLQDFTATIHKTSQLNGGKFDIIHVETLIVTDEPIPSDTLWYVPNDKPVDSLYQSIFQQCNVNPEPTISSEIDKRIEDFKDAIEKAQAGATDETHEDISTLALLSVLSKTTLHAIEGTTTTYRLTYDYKLYPKETGTNVFELQVTLPFAGFIMPDNGDEIQITVVTPIGAVIDKDMTKGIAANGTAITPQYAEFPSSKKQAISFDYVQDPKFTIRYHY